MGYRVAGGALVLDLFDAEEGGFLTNPALLDRLVRAQLEAAAAPVRAEGWAWVTVEPEFDYALTAGMRHVYPRPLPLDPEQEAQRAALEARHKELAATDEDAWTEVALEAELDALTGTEQFSPEDIVRAVVVVSLRADGEVQIERGFLRKEDAAKASRASNEGDDEATAATGRPARRRTDAYRTVGLLEALAQHPATALVAVVHALAA